MSDANNNDSKAEGEAEAERLRRWRLILGAAAQEDMAVELGGDEQRMDEALGALYDGARGAGLGGAAPSVARWLGDIRTYFPSSVVRVMQKDALERLDLERVLEPELLEAVEADVHLVSTLLSLSRVIPARTRESARRVVRQVVAALEAKLRERTVQAVRGSLDRSTRRRRPRPEEIHWDRTIRRNLAHYIAERRTIIAEELIGHGRRGSSLRDVVLCTDQSGSMAASVVYASVFAAVLASLRSLSMRFVVFGTEVVDLTDSLTDPVDLLFGTQLGGGTDIASALAYCQQVIVRPSQTVLVLISDLVEGGNVEHLHRRAAELVAAGVQVICLLALSDQGAPSYDAANARRFALLGIPTFAVTPDLFPELMAAALAKRDVGLWAARHDIVTAR